MKHLLLLVAILVGGFTNSLLADQLVVYTANWEQSDFSTFGPQGGIIEVLYQTDSTGSSGLPDDLFLSFEFAPYSDQHFSFNASVFTTANELMIGVNETYSDFIEDTSQLTVESAPEFAGWNLDERVLDQAGLSALGLYIDPKTNQEVFFETIFTADDITENPPPSGVFKTFALTYSNLVPPVVPADQVPKAHYTLFSDAITYSSVPEPSSIIMLATGALGLLAYGRRGLKRNAGVRV